MLNPTSRENEPFDLLTFLQRKDVQQWIMVGLAVAIGFLVLRRSKSSPGLAVGLSLMGSTIFSSDKPALTTSSDIEHPLLRNSLKEIGNQGDLLTPTELWEKLKERNVVFPTAQQMGHALGAMGLHSEIRTVAGRPERRWYNLTAWNQQDEPRQIAS